MVEKTFDNLEPCDVVAINGTKYVIVQKLGSGYIISGGANGSGCNFYEKKYMIDQKWKIEKPLTAAEKAAKALLEACGFRVTR